MAKIGNEAKLILKLATERMRATRLGWIQKSSNPNSNSHDDAWLSGYEYAWREWSNTLYEVAAELEK